MLIIILIVVVAALFSLAVFFCGFALGMWHGQVQALNQIPAREIEKERQLAEIRMKEQAHLTDQAKARNDNMAAAMKTVYEAQAIASAAARSGGIHVN